MDSYQKFIAASRYARWLPEEGRREEWWETVHRYTQFFADRCKLTVMEQQYLGEAILRLDVMPSMRCMMTAGPALERDNVAGYNCSYLPLDHPRAFDELMYILLCGTGVGFSVERQYIQQLPGVPEQLEPSPTTIVVSDSKIGWAKAFRELLSLLWAGQVPSWDTSRVRAAGEPLKTFGGRASGPQPLVDLFEFTVATFRRAQGRGLSSLEAHDLACKIGEVVVVGGVRRSALISLSSPTDDRLRRAKSGQWWMQDPQRALANNSACYEEKPTFDFFLKEMEALYESKSGERGFFSRAAAKKVAGRNGRRETEGMEFGTNPCSEIILRPNQFCNLSEVVVRAEDTPESLLKKVEYATILGTLQSTLTDFRYLRSIWRKNTEEEALLGVSLTGIMDNPTLLTAELLEQLRQKAIDVNAAWAERLGVNPSAAITCVKPSGTVSQLVNSASGIHPRFAPYYLRRVRCDREDPMAQYMAQAGFPHEEDVHNPKALVFAFPQRAPKGATCTKDMGALAQLELWKKFQDHWCEHKPSITVYYTDDEFLAVAQWVWENFDYMSGISLLPYDDHTYQQAPYEEIDYNEYRRLSGELPEFDWGAMARFENGDTTTGSQELACTGGACELPDPV